jgi:hypothetical protein
MSQFEFTYCKRKQQTQSQLFETLEKANTGLRNLQNYIPMYRRFFLLSESNHNSIGLNHRYTAESVTASGISKHVVIATLKSESDDKPVPKVPAFIKYSPLLDPIKYMSGKYDAQAHDLLQIPMHGDMMRNSLHKTKMHDVNNSSYVDAFFTYLTSQMLHTHGFVHGLDFYGSYLANQDEFTVNIYDELEYFSTCDFFLKHKDKLFRVDELTSSPLFKTSRSRSSQQLIKLGDAETMDLNLEELTSFNEVFEAQASQITLDTLDPLDVTLDTLDTLDELDTLDTLDDTRMNVPSIKNHSKSNSTNSDDSDSCSSRSSDDQSAGSVRNGDGHEGVGVDDANDHDDPNDDPNDEVDDDGSSDDGSSDCDDDDEEVHNAHIFNFPVHAIMMEKCDNTLDSLMFGKNELTEPEWAATLMQVIMTLIAYNHMFAFTHNDLHTNNIMFVKTDKKFLHYLHKGVYYRVPTHGRIMKIIDFGRAIYKYRGQTMCSDSFDRGGDAATQYNCDPYLNPKKPRLDPNPSFDLCRLACSLFDYFVEDIREEAECAAKSRVASVVVEWLKDDKGRNVLYKKNGDERYPEFKLYKMIARTVHGAVPHEQLQRPMFAHFAIQRKHINGKPHIMNIDALPCCRGATDVDVDVPVGF